MPNGSPVAEICSIFPPRLNNAGGCPALQIATAPFFDARPQIRVAYCPGSVLSPNSLLARSVS